MDIKQIDEQINYLQAVRKAIQEKPGDIESEIIQTYCIIESGTKVAKILNEKGYRKNDKNKTTWKPNDITEVICTGGESRILNDLAYKIFKGNYKRVSRLYN